MGHSQDLGSSTNRRMRGDPFQDFQTQRQGQWEKAVVQFVNTQLYSVDVYTESGKYLTNLAWPSSCRDPETPAGEISVPKIGQFYFVSYEFGAPVLTGSVPPAPRQTAQTQPDYHTLNPDEGSKTAELGAHVRGPDFRDGRPPDLLPGDWMRLGSEGNLLGVLEGGITVLKASDLAQIIANKVGDLLRLVGRNMDVMTDFGEVKFKNENGRTSLTVKGGAQQTTESSPHKDNFTIHAEVGAAGDLIDFRITDLNGRVKYSTHVDPDGNVKSFTNESREEVTEGSKLTRVGGDQSDHIVGNHTEKTDGSEDKTVLGNQDTTVGGALSTRTVTGDMNLSAGQAMNLSSTRQLNVTIGGSIDKPVPGAAAATTTVNNGTWFVDIGNPLAGDIPSAKSGLHVKTRLGDIEFNSDAGKIQFKTKIPNSVLLGGQSGIFSGVLFETLEKFLMVFGKMIDTHTHATGVGPSSPPIPLPFTASQALLKTAKSTYVKIGG